MVEKDSILSFTARMIHAWMLQVCSSIALEVSSSSSWHSRISRLGLACADTVSNSAKCFSLHALQQSKFQEALRSKLLLLMRALYSNPFLGKAHCERNEVNFVKSYCGRAGAALLNPSGQFPWYRSLHLNFPMKPNLQHASIYIFIQYL